MAAAEKIRIDKFLWAARIYKTRSIASDECRKGRITVNGIPAKPSHVVYEKDIITVRKLPVVYSYEVIQPFDNRVAAKLVENFIRDITPATEKEKLVLAKNAGFGTRPKGFGRPTKKERRTIDRLNDSNTEF
jgi:ribosome-associated heat shock protein Hsp15